MMVLMVLDLERLKVPALMTELPQDIHLHKPLPPVGMKILSTNGDLLLAKSSTTRELKSFLAQD